MSEFDTCVHEAQRVVARTGTWLLYDVRNAENLAELVGFLRYTSQGFEVRLRSARLHRHPKQQAKVRSWIASWRRAARWVMGLDHEQASAVAAAVLRQAQDVPFYVPCGHPWLTVQDEPPRPPGRPRVRATPKKYPECRACHGLGFR